MSKRRLSRTTLWLLPLLLIKGLVPAGFMLDVSHDKISIIVCHGHHGVPASQQDDKPSTPKTDGLLCPFAAAAGAVTLNSSYVIAIGPSLIGQFNAADAPSAPAATGPARAQQSRAPPRTLI